MKNLEYIFRTQYIIISKVGNPYRQSNKVRRMQEPADWMDEEEYVDKEEERDLSFSLAPDTGRSLVAFHIFFFHFRSKSLHLKATDYSYRSSPTYDGVTTRHPKLKISLS